MFYSIALVLTTTGLALAATGEEDVVCFFAVVKKLSAVVKLIL